ncbi:MAG: antibiotic biosynthesis monooxygenase family protein [Nannocystaceae bacterium]
MNVEYIHYDVDPSQADAFVAAFQEALALLEREPSVLYHELVQDCDDPRKFVVRIEWQTRESQRTYLTNPDYARFMGLIKPHHGSFVSMRFHDPRVVAARGKEPAAAS